MFGAVLGLHQDVGGGSGGTDGYVVTGAGHSSHDTWMALTSGKTLEVLVFLLWICQGLSGNFNGFCPLLEKCGASKTRMCWVCGVFLSCFIHLFHFWTPSATENRVTGLQRGRDPWNEDRHCGMMASFKRAPWKAAPSNHLSGTLSCWSWGGRPAASCWKKGIRFFAEALPIDPWLIHDRFLNMGISWDVTHQIQQRKGFFWI